MSGELRKYEVYFRVKMPGQAKENEYKLLIPADDPTEATMKGIEEWKRVTEPRDVRVKEIEKVMSVS